MFYLVAVNVLSPEDENGMVDGEIVSVLATTAPRVLAEMIVAPKFSAEVGNLPIAVYGEDDLPIEVRNFIDRPADDQATGLDNILSKIRDRKNMYGHQAEVN